MAIKPDEANSVLEWRSLLGYERHYAKLFSLLTQDKLPPVILFAGRMGIGKRHFLHGFAALHFCQAILKLETKTPCATCESCSAILAGDFPDILWIDGRSQNLLLEHADQIQQHLSIKPRRFGANTTAWRIVMVSDVDKMNHYGVNRLLKIIEEPPEQTRIVFTTSRLRSLLPTLLSRSLVWPIAPAPKPEATAFLAKHFPEMKTKDIEGLLDQNGLAIGRVFEQLQENGSGDKSWESTQIWDILSGLKLADLLKNSELIGRQQKIPASDLARRAEHAINQAYRTHFLGSQGPALEPNFLAPLTVFSRRDLLRRLKEASIKQRIAINTQLAAEHLGGLHLRL